MNDSAPAAGTGQGTVTAAAPTPVPAPAPVVPQAATTVMASAATDQPLGGIQLFAAPEPTPVSAPSLTSHCSKVSLLTSSNGGYVTVASMTDPELALGEQFCLARSYAINAGEGMIAKLNGVTQAQIDNQCDAFGPAVKPFLAKLSSTPSQQMVAEVQKFVLQSNMSLEQLANTAGICLFSGYRRDNMDVALGAALVMVGVGQRPYGELVGHHLAQGYGTQTSHELAREWYNVAVSALENGAEPVFAPGQPERVQLIKAASGRLDGNLVQPVAAAAAGAALPSFSFD